MAFLFAYGTLQVEEVMRTVTGRRYSRLPALLPGYGRYVLRGRVYPGIIKDPGGETTGVLYAGLGQDALALLDTFEDACYERRCVLVRTREAERIKAQAYVIPGPRSGLLSSEPWELEAFLREHGAAFLKDIHLEFPAAVRPGKAHEV